MISGNSWYGGPAVCMLLLFVLPAEAGAGTLSENVEVLAEIKSESALETKSGDLQKWNLVLMPQVLVDLTSQLRLTAIARIRSDVADNLVNREPRESSRDSISHHVFLGDTTDIEIREFYLDTYIGDASLRVGKQQIVWGQADGLRVLDVVNPLDFREFILTEFEDRRIPLWTVNLETSLGRAWNLQFIWIPDETYDVMPESGSSFAFTSHKILPTVPAGVPVTLELAAKPDRFFKDSDFGFRLTSFLGGWDLSLNYLYHYYDQAVLYRKLDEQGVIIAPRYERTHLIGASFSNAYGDFAFRGEAAYSTSRHFVTNDARDLNGIYATGELRYVLGLDYTYDADLLISGQLFQSIVNNHAVGSARDRVESQFTFLIKKDILNDALTIEMLAVHSLSDGDGLIQTALRYQLTSNIELSTGLDLFYGPSNGVFGQFNHRDRMTFGVQIGL